MSGCDSDLSNRVFGSLYVTSMVMGLNCSIIPPAVNASAYVSPCMVNLTMHMGELIDNQHMLMSDAGICRAFHNYTMCAKMEVGTMPPVWRGMYGHMVKRVGEYTKLRCEITGMLYRCEITGMLNRCEPTGNVEQVWNYKYVEQVWTHR